MLIAHFCEFGFFSRFSPVFDKSSIEYEVNAIYIVYIRSISMIDKIKWQFRKYRFEEELMMQMNDIICCRSTGKSQQKSTSIENSLQVSIQINLIISRRIRRRKILRTELKTWNQSHFWFCKLSIGIKPNRTEYE